MAVTAPKDVLKALRVFFKSYGIKQKEVASVLGYKTTQAAVNLLNSNSYLNKAQAESICSRYNVSFDFLTKGEGQLVNPYSNAHSLNDSIKLSGNAEKMFYRYVSEVFEATASALGNEQVNKIWNELIRLAEALETVGASGNAKRASDLEPIFTQTKILVDATIEKIARSTNRAALLAEYLK